jgi:hypothetical protein
MQRRAAVIVLLVALAAAVLLYLRWRAGEAAQVRRTIEVMRQAGEAKDAERFMSYLSPSYRDHLGFQYELVARLVEIVTRGPEKYRVTLRGLRVSVKGKSAVARMNASVTIDRGEPLTGDLLVELRKEGGRWRATSSAGWQDFFADESPRRAPGSV